MPEWSDGMSSNKWIFLRGLTRGNIHWGNFEEIFKRINPNAEMEFMEIPGNGFLHNEKSPINAKKVIDILRDKSKFSRQNLPFNICGISLGGMVALKWAELYPEEIASVAIINSSLRQYSSFYERLIPNNYAKLITALFNSDEAEQERIILTITSNKFEITKNYVEAFSVFSKKYHVSKTNFTRQLLLASSVKIENFPNIPLKIISSNYDRLVSSSCSDKIAKGLGGKQYVHPTAGHDLPLDEPEWLCEILLSK
jgi:pimeloyl-ACP methyl ester carboxylesterase